MMARLTYAELGERLGLSTEAARMLARRRCWRIERGNDGKARALVPEEELVERPVGRPPERPVERDRSADRVAELQEELLRLTERAARAEGAEMALRELVDELKAQLARERARRHDAEVRARRPWWRRLLG